MAKRQSLNARYLGQAYWSVLGSPPFLLACAGLAMMFSGFFIYVLSAPVFLMTHLGRSATDFLWLFGPATAGMVSGSWLSGYLAGKRSRPATLFLGFVIMGGAAVVNLLISALLPAAIPWSVAPLFFYTLGMSLAMPSLTLYALDPFPEKRGLAASCQTFLQAGSNGLVAALVAPAVWGSTLSLAAAMLGFFCVGSLAAWQHQRSALIPG